MNGNEELLRFEGGTSYNSYEYLGVHREDKDYVFRVWAPRADTVCIVGDFIGWNDGQLMTFVGSGIWETRISADNISEGQFYKYKIKSGERIFYKADPYAFCSWAPPETASVICNISKYKWRDSGWLSYRSEKADSLDKSQPVNIYRLHAMSWKQHYDGKPYSWSELATELSTYVKQMGYTHIELMPITEWHWEDAFGHCVSSYFSPNARLGTPLEFMGFVDSMHEAGIGVIMDWIPTCVSNEEYSLVEFDGQPLYECGKDSCEKRSRFFDLSKNEVKSFLISNVMFWINTYHIDGICVSSALSGSDKSDDDAMEFYRRLKDIVNKSFSDVLMFCEEESSEIYFNSADNSEQWLALSRLEIAYRTVFARSKVKRSFMGFEIGQIIDCNNISPVNWSLLDNDDNAKLQYYVSELNHFCLGSFFGKKKNALAYSEESFCVDGESGDVLCWHQGDDNGKELIIIFNPTTDVKDFTEYCENKIYKIIFNSDEKRFGGKGMITKELFKSENGKIKLDVPPLAMIILQCV